MHGDLYGVAEPICAFDLYTVLSMNIEDEKSPLIIKLPLSLKPTDRRTTLEFKNFNQRFVFLKYSFISFFRKLNLY